MTTRLPAAILTLALFALPLAACGSDESGDDERTASGEVLDGTISDAMLPLDTVTSEPPLLKPETPATTASGDTEAEADGEASAEAEAEETPIVTPPAPTATPSPTASAT